MTTQSFYDLSSPLHGTGFILLYLTSFPSQLAARYLLLVGCMDFPFFAPRGLLTLAFRSLHLFVSHLEWQAWDTAVFRVTF